MSSASAIRNQDQIDALGRAIDRISKVIDEMEYTEEEEEDDEGEW